MIRGTYKGVVIKKIGPKLLEIEPSRILGGVHDCIGAIPDIQERHNIKSVFVVGPRIYLVIE